MFLDSIMPVISWVMPFLLVLTVLVFIHELGHYLVARYNGVKIEVFSIGFGPEIMGWNDSHGTRWKFSLIPLGGYVRMFGDANEASVPDFDRINTLSPDEHSQTLNAKTVWQRMAVSVAGPAANLLLTFFLLSLVFVFVGKSSDQTVIGAVTPGNPAYLAGLQAGDRIVKLNDFTPASFQQMQAYINAHPQESIFVQRERGGVLSTLSVISASLDVGSGKKIGFIGVAPVIMSQSILTAPIEALKSIVRMSGDLLKLLGSVVSSGENASKLGSVLSIAKMSKDSLHGGIFSLFFFMAVLSLNLGVINLLPIPMLDGGHILFYIIEAVRGKPVREKGQNIAYKIGFGVLIFVMLFTLWNDLMRFKIVEYFLNFFK